MRLDAKNLSVSRGGRPILTGVDLHVPSGAVLGVLGANGGGKSTLLAALCKLLPFSGSVRIGDADLAGLKRQEVARTVAHMAQEFSADFEMLVYDVVLLGRTPHAGWGTSERDHEVVAWALKQAGAEALAARVFADLSGGERQRVTFARVLAQDAPVLVLDEPTNHLDIAHQFELLRLVRESGRTAVVALHDLDLAARHCDLVAVLHRGTVLTCGAPAEVLTDRVVRSVFGVSSTPVTHPISGQTRLLLDPLPAASTAAPHTPENRKKAEA